MITCRLVLRVSVYAIAFEFGLVHLVRYVRALIGHANSCDGRYRLLVCLRTYLGLLTSFHSLTS